MQKFIGVKLVTAVLMTRAAWCESRGWNLPEDEDGNDEGYEVEYLDGGKPNIEGRDGYVSWCPKEQFENANRSTEGMSFGLAVEAMKKGLRVARTGWNGKGMFCFLVDGSVFTVNRVPLNKFYPEGDEVKYNPHIDICNPDGSIGTWSPSNGDALADDWVIVE